MVGGAPIGTGASSCVYDADESSFTATAPVPSGSAATEDPFEQYFIWQGVPYDDSAFSAIWGGTAGDQFDPCYHLVCDTYDNNNEALSQNSDAIAFALLTLAYSTEAVNGVLGQAVPGSNPLGLPTELAGPEFTFVPGDGGDHDHDHDHEHDAA